jgi:hypothetical protein
MAYNIAVHGFTATGPVLFSSEGYGLGGFDSVLSVFQGSGNSASYLDHQYAPFSAGDFQFTLNLAPGVYTLAVSMTFNEPCAAGFCFDNGTFADGFTNLVNFDASRPDPLFYSVVITEVNAVPEPALGAIAGLALTVLLVYRRKTCRHF